MPAETNCKRYYSRNERSEDSDYKNLVFVGTDQGVSVVETAGTTGTNYVGVVDIQQSEGDYTLALSTDSGTETTAETSTKTSTETSAEYDYGEQAYGGVEA